MEGVALVLAAGASSTGLKVGASIILASCSGVNRLLSKASAFSSLASKIVSCLVDGLATEMTLTRAMLSHTCESGVFCYVCRRDSGACIADRQRRPVWCRRIGLCGDGILGTLWNHRPAEAAGRPASIRMHDERPYWIWLIVFVQMDVLTIYSMGGQLMSGGQLGTS